MSSLWRLETRVAERWLHESEAVKFHISIDFTSPSFPILLNLSTTIFVKDM